MDLYNQFDKEPITQPPRLNKSYYNCDGINGLRCSGFTHLMKLVMLTKKYPELVEKIKDHINEINKVNEHGNTALILACRNIQTVSSIETVRELMKCGADANIKNKDGMTAFVLAASESQLYSSIEVIQEMIKAGIDINIGYKNGWTTLMHACRWSKKMSSLETIQWLIKSGANLDMVNDEGMTALIIAVRNLKSCNSSMDCVYELIDSGCNVNIVDKNNCSALMYSCMHPVCDINLDLFDRLIKAGADVNSLDVQNTSILCFALDGVDKYSDSIIIAQRLIKNGANVNQYSKRFNKTPLLIACEKSKTDGMLEIIKLLIEYGANIHQTNENGYDALMIACSNLGSGLSSVKAVELLINMGADVNKQSIIQSSFYHETYPIEACLKCRNAYDGESVEALKLLVNAGADVNIVRIMANQTHQTLLDMIFSRKIFHNEHLVEIIKILLKAGFNINNNNRNIIYKLLTHVSNDHYNVYTIELVHAFLNIGANPNVVTHYRDSIVSTMENKNIYTTIIVHDLILTGLDVELLLKNYKNGIQNPYYSRHIPMTHIGDYLCDKSINSTIVSMYKYKPDIMQQMTTFLNDKQIDHISRFQVYVQNIKDTLIEHRNEFYIRPNHIDSILCECKFIQQMKKQKEDKPKLIYLFGLQ